MERRLSLRNKLTIYWEVYPPHYLRQLRSAFDRTRRTIIDYIPHVSFWREKHTVFDRPYQGWHFTVNQRHRFPYKPIWELHYHHPRQATDNKEIQVAHCPISGPCHNPVSGYHWSLVKANNPPT